MQKIEKVLGEVVDRYDEYSVVKNYERNIFIPSTPEDVLLDDAVKESLVSYAVIYKGAIIEICRKIAVFKNCYGYQFELIVEELTKNLLKDLEKKHKGKFIKVYNVETEDEFYNYREVNEDGQWKDYAKSRVGREEIEKLRTEIDELNKGGINEI